MFKTGMVGGRVDQRDETELADPGKPPERGRVDQSLDTRSKRNILFRRDPDQAAVIMKTLDFR